MGHRPFPVGHWATAGLAHVRGRAFSGWKPRGVFEAMGEKG